ncbi:putative baseplate assembly protein [Massilia mucilaginosa]|uniref:putative baseplate assembly protein n=1 Tax=Massilia mucilaginosa TaxID=2609282 RepID=UPI001CB6E022|nr:putative baseplate assembly protein [Massilia mucilaginosa]
MDPLVPDPLEPPQLATPGRAAVRAALAARIAAFTPEWRRHTPGDAGDALLGLHGELAEPLLERLNRMPEKAFREYLRAAGIAAVPARPARATLSFTVADAAPGSALIAPGFQVSAAAADGSGARVVFETERALYAAPGKIAATFAQDGKRFFAMQLGGADPAASNLVFGAAPRPGAALLIGLSGASAPAPNITFMVHLTARGGPPPVIAHGGMAAGGVVAQPIVGWSFFDGGRFEPAEVIRDESRGLLQSGLVELRCPRTWRTGIPAGVTAPKPLRWLRLQLVAGAFAAPPALAFIELNAVTASAARTVRGEVLDYVPDSDGRRMRVTQRPVLPGSLQLTVDEGAIGAAAVGAQPWLEIAGLDASGPDERVFELDEVTGELQFGDGMHGMQLPRGMRHVVAQRYQVATGAAGAVAAGQITSLMSSVPFVTKVGNALPASGGHDAMSIPEASRLGPQRLRARNRAVTVADYELESFAAQGADVTRAHGVGGTHAGLNNARVPGTVSVFLLGPRAVATPPYPSQASLDAVASHLSSKVAPAGVEVVAAAPHFHEVSVRATLAVAIHADFGEVLRATLRELDGYFDPLAGGGDGRGWPFGGVIKYAALVRHLIAHVPGLVALSTLNLTVDGEALGACSDFTPQPHSLLWPLPHELRVVEKELP